MNEYLSELNQQQRDAVLYLDSPQLVIAGAGSGKTRVLTYKIVHLLAKGYHPWRILALTFTNKAAREMRQRIEQLTGNETSRKLWMGTFHSVFLRILHQHFEKIGFKRDFTIYDTSDSKALIKTIIKDMNLDDKVYKPSTIQNAISMAKNALISPEAYAADRELTEADRRSKKPLIYTIYSIYQERCRIANAMDFDDILFFTNVLLRDNPDILNHYREYFQYILVDEYQDTNFAQHLIIRRLTEGQNNLSVVGDDAQSIYSFRGANINHILNIKSVYPDLRIFKLERNYRSTRNIIDAANSLIEKNTLQIKKQVFSENEDGRPIEVIQGYSDFEEGYLISNRISQIKYLNHDSFSDFAILYRTNAQSRILEESLRKRNIPYRIYGGLSFYQRKEIKDAIAYFRLTVNPFDDEALTRIINYPSRGIGETTLKKVSTVAHERGVSMWEIISDSDSAGLKLTSGTKKKLESFCSLISSFISALQKGMNAYELGELIIRKSQLLSVLLSDRTPESISKQENLEELLNGMRTFVEEKNEQGDLEHTSITDFLGEVSLATDFDRSDDTTGEAVTLMTVHSAKGLEFKNVVIVGVEEDLFPSAMSLNSFEEIEEERRLLYVAITRAKNLCVMSYANTRYRNGQTVATHPSRFFNDIDRRYLNIAGASKIIKPSEKTVNPIANYSRFAKPMDRNVPNSSADHSTAAQTDNEYRIHDISELEIGMIILHNRFGKGRIAAIETNREDDRIIVLFSANEKKTLLLKYARFKIIE